MDAEMTTSARKTTTSAEAVVFLFCGLYNKLKEASKRLGGWLEWQKEHVGY
jgi:hypothetical protein